MRAFKRRLQGDTAITSAAGPILLSGHEKWHAMQARSFEGWLRAVKDVQEIITSDSLEQDREFLLSKITNT